MSTGQLILDDLWRHGLIPSISGWRVESASGGLNSRMYYAVNPDGQRQLTVRLARPGVDLGNQVAVMADLSACKAVPGVLFADEKSLVHEYLPGKPAQLNQVRASSVVRLTAALACIHKHERLAYTIWPKMNPHVGTRRDLFEQRHGVLRHYHSYERNLLADASPDLERMLAYLVALEFQDPAWEDRTFSRLHGDLSVGNILWSESGVHLIDWEYARDGDPAEDLAYLITEQPVSIARMQLIRESYVAAGGDPQTWRCVGPYALFTALDSAFWWADYVLERDIDPISHPEVVARLETARKWVGD